MDFLNYVIFLIAISQSEVRSRSLEVPDEFECVKDKTKRSGLCAIDVGNKCCEGFRGDECKKNVAQYLYYASPELEFLPNSLVVDDRMKLLCIKGFKVKEGEALKDREIRGIHLALEVFRDNELGAFYSTSIDFIFHGHVSSVALKNSLLCIDLDLDSNELKRKSNFINLAMVALPPAKERDGLRYGSFERLCEIPRVEIFHKHCHEWTAKPMPPVQCGQTTTNSSIPQERRIVTTTTTRNPIVPIVMRYNPGIVGNLCSIVIVVLCLAIFFSIGRIASALSKKKPKSNNCGVLPEGNSKDDESKKLTGGDDIEKEQHSHIKKGPKSEESQEQESAQSEEAHHSSKYQNVVGTW